MFSGTIAQNLRNVMPDASDEDIIKALQLACAWNFVSKLPDGINSEIKERGGGFSEGQAQRLSIARAILRRSPFLLLDEATSALDVTVQRQIMELLWQLRDSQGISYLFICHNLALVQAFCHRVLVMRQGKIVEEGTADEVILHPKTGYARMLADSVMETELLVGEP